MFNMSKRYILLVAPSLFVFMFAGYFVYFHRAHEVDVENRTQQSSGSTTNRMDTIAWKPLPSLPKPSAPDAVTLNDAAGITAKLVGVWKLISPYENRTIEFRKNGTYAWKEDGVLWVQEGGEIHIPLGSSTSATYTGMWSMVSDPCGEAITVGHLGATNTNINESLCSVISERRLRLGSKWGEIVVALWMPKKEYAKHFAVSLGVDGNTLNLDPVAREPEKYSRLQ